LITPIIIDPSRSNEVVYVIEIPKSTTAHQNSDKKYYRRYNFQSIPMDDWEIKDIINRVTRTQAFLRLKKSRHFDFQMKANPPKGLKMEFEVQLVNVGMKAITIVECFVKGNSTINNNLISPKAEFDEEFVEWNFNNERSFSAAIGGSEFIINTQRIPILPHTFHVLGNIELYSDFFINKGKLNLTITTEDNVFKEVVTGEEIFKLD
jgi:hypothetical protein